MKYNILVLDDEKEIADLVELYLKNEDYNIYKFYSSKEALKCINETKLDLAILDIMLPDTDGFSICNEIRKKYKPCIIKLIKLANHRIDLNPLNLIFLSFCFSI